MDQEIKLKLIGERFTFYLLPFTFYLFTFHDIRAMTVTFLRLTKKGLEAASRATWRGCGGGPTLLLKLQSKCMCARCSRANTNRVRKLY